MKKLTSLLAMLFCMALTGANAQGTDYGTRLTPAELNAITSPTKIAIECSQIHNFGKFYNGSDKDATFNENSVFVWEPAGNGEFYIRKAYPAEDATAIYLGSANAYTWVELASAQKFVAGSVTQNVENEKYDDYKTYGVRITKSGTNSFMNANGYGYAAGTGCWSVQMVYPVAKITIISKVGGETTTVVDYNKFASKDYTIEEKAGYEYTVEGATVTDGKFTATNTADLTVTVTYEASSDPSVLARVELQATLDAANAIAWGTEVGECVKTAEITNAIATAQSLIDEVSTDVAAINAANTALAAAIASPVMNMPKAGKLYQIVSGLNFTKGQMAIYSADGGLRWKAIDVNDHAFYWYIEPVSEGKYTVKNFYTEKYVGVATQSNWVKESESAVDITISSLGQMQFNFGTGSGTNQMLHCGGHDSGAGTAGDIVGWDGGLGTASTWKIVTVDDATQSSLEAQVEVARARAELHAAIAEASKNLFVTIPLSDSNVTCNEPEDPENEKGSVIAHLFDGNKATYFHTMWSNRQESSHYLQIDLGEDVTIDEFAFSTVNRSGASADFPKAYKIEGSNDLEAGFTQIATVDDTEADVAGKEFLSELLGTSGTGYRYLRFTVTDCYGAGYRVYFHLAEFRLLKCSNLYDNWAASIAEAEAADVPEATAEQLRAAIEKLQHPDWQKEVKVKYNFMYNGAVKLSETLDASIGAEYPEFTVDFPFGVSATKPDGIITNENVVDGVKTVEVNVNVNLPFEPVAQYADITTWYNLRLKSKYMYHDPTSDKIDASQASVNFIALDEDDYDSYQWAFVGDPFSGFSIVNKLAGSTMVLTSPEPTSDQDLTYPVMGEGNQVWDVYASSYATNGFFIAYDGTMKRMNSRGDKLSYWLGDADAGSTFTVEISPSREDLFNDVLWEYEVLYDDIKDNPETVGYHTKASRTALGNLVEKAQIVSKNNVATEYESKFIRIGTAQTEIVSGKWYFVHNPRIPYQNAKAEDFAEAGGNIKSAGGLVTARATDSGLSKTSVIDDLADVDGELANYHTNSLVRFVADPDKAGVYKVQFGTGNWMGASLTPVEADYAANFNLYKIKVDGVENDNAQFGWNLYDKDKIVDNNGAGNNMAYWSTGEVTSINGNNAWQIYDVEIVGVVGDKYKYALDQLSDAYNGLETIGPDPTKFYSIVSECEGTRNGKQIYVNNDGAMKFASADEIAASGGSLHSVFQFEDAGEGKFYMRNVVRGTYLSTAKGAAAGAQQAKAAENSSAKAVTITNMGSENIVKIVPDGGPMMHAEEATSSVVGWDHDYYAGASAWTIVEVDDMSAVSHKLTVGEAGYATLYLGQAVIVPAIEGDGNGVYAATELGSDIIKMEAVEDVLPANTAVIVKAPAGTYEFNYSADAGTATSVLKGTVFNEVITPESGVTCYVLGKVGEDVGMYKAKLNRNEGTAFLNNAGKAYLSVPAAAARFFIFNFGDVETGIENIEGAENANGAAIYDLSGRRVQKTQKGLYIINGNKVVK